MPSSLPELRAIEQLVGELEVDQSRMREAESLLRETVVSGTGYAVTQPGDALSVPSAFWQLDSLAQGASQGAYVYIDFSDGTSFLPPSRMQEEIDHAFAITTASLREALGLQPEPPPAPEPVPCPDLSSLGWSDHYRDAAEREGWKLRMSWFGSEPVIGLIGNREQRERELGCFIPSYPRLEDLFRFIRDGAPLPHRMKALDIVQQFNPGQFALIHGTSNQS